MNNTSTGTNKIKFSHVYDKMPFDGWIPDTKLEATILEIFLAEKKDLNVGFVEYDTSFFERDYSTSKTFMKKNNYPLPNGKLIILLLQSYNSSGLHIWTTVRRWTAEKEQYYRSKRGERFEAH